MTQQQDKEQVIKDLRRFEEKSLRFLVRCKKKQNHREVCAAFAIFSRFWSFSDKIARMSDKDARDYAHYKFPDFRNDFSELSFVLIRASYNDGRALLDDELMELLSDSYEVERELREYTGFAFAHLYL